MSGSRDHTFPVLILSLAIVLCLLVGTHAPRSAPLGADDHGQYLLHARALIEHRPYTDIGFFHSRYTTMNAPLAEPPGVPALAAGLFWLAGRESVGLVRLMLCGFLVGFAYLLFRYLREHLDTGWNGQLALLATAWTVTALVRQDAVDAVLADVPFCAAIWLSFVIADASGPWTPARWATLAVSGAAAFSFRMAALPLLPAIASWVVLTKELDKRVRLLALGVFWCAAAYAVLFGLPGASALASESSRGVGHFLNTVAVNAKAVIDGVRGAIPFSVPWKPANLAVHAGFFVILFVGLYQEIRHRQASELTRQFAFLFSGWYVVMLLVLPTHHPRYLWPLLPFVVFGFLKGLQHVVRKLPVSQGLTPGKLVAASAALMLLAGVTEDALADRPASFADDPAVRNVLETLNRQGGAASVRVMVFSPRNTTWHTRIPAMPLIAAPENEIWNEVERNGITHIVTGDPTGYLDRPELVQNFVTNNPARFQPVGGAGVLSVYRILAAASNIQSPPNPSRANPHQPDKKLLGREELH